MKYYIYPMFGLDTEQASNLAGYTIKTGYKMNSQLNKDPKIQVKLERFLDKFPQQYKSLCRLNLPKIYELERKMLTKTEKDPTLAIKHGGTPSY